MKKAVIGFDTSNYRTSAAVVTEEKEIILNYRHLLPVPQGAIGLRQNEAVFAHIRNLEEASGQIQAAIRENGLRIAGVSASVRPRDPEDSYMPVFHVGKMAAELLAAACLVPMTETTHQRGHLAAAAYGTALRKNEKALAVHLSGGTTDLLYLEGDRLERIGGSLDLHAGQMVDRVGVFLGLGFPAGPELEMLALKGVSSGMLGCSMEKDDCWCHFSGAETKALNCIRNGNITPENLAREVYDLLVRTLVRMLCAGERKTGAGQALISGGVASSDLLRKLLTERLRKAGSRLSVFFGSPELSGDNAAGVALTGLEKLLSSGTV